MNILKTATDWVKAEVFSSAFFILFGVMFALASWGFWQWGKTDVSRAYVIPAMVAGLLLLGLWLGLVFSNQSRVAGFAATYNSGASAFVASEITRVDKVLNDYRIAVFTIIPLIIVVCAALILVLDTPLWRASLITSIAMMAAILLVDTNAYARLQAYKAQLVSVEQQE